MSPPAPESVSALPLKAADPSVRYSISVHLEIPASHAGSNKSSAFCPFLVLVLLFFPTLAAEIMAESKWSRSADVVADQLQFIKKGTDSYPEGFFEKVQQLSVGSNTVLIMDNYIFLILRENPSEDEAKQYYDRYRDDCLKSLRGDEFKTIVEGYASELSVERNDRVINKAVKEVLKDG